MKNYGKIGVILLLGILILGVNSYAGKKRTLSRTFDDIDRIKIKTVSGDCVIKKGSGDEITLEVEYSYYPRDSFEPRIRERGSTLRLAEEMFGSNSGSSLWILTVPDGIEVEFATASGDFGINGVDGIFNATTASGDLELINSSGEFELSTASGDIIVDDCHGEFQLSTASGSIDAIGVVLDEESSFSTASGRVDVTLAETAKYDLNVGSASGSAILDYDGNPIKGMFEFQAKVRKGRIVSPIDFDNEETFRKWDDKYVRKTFTKGSDTPLITIGTATGKAVLKEG